MVLEMSDGSEETQPDSGGGGSDGRTGRGPRYYTHIDCDERQRPGTG